MPALVFPETPTEGELFPTVNPRWQWVSNRWAPIGIFTGNSTLPLGTYVLWPTADLGFIPAGFLVADGTEGTEDMTLEAIGPLSFIVRSNGLAPQFVGAEILADGDEMEIAFDEIVTGSGGGFTTSMSGGAVTWTYVSGSGTDTLLYSASRTILDGETGTISYTPGNWEDAIGNALEEFLGEPVTNSSTQTGASATPTFVAFNSNTHSASRSPVVNYPSGATENDIVLAFFGTQTLHTSDGTPPTGWTKLGTQDTGTRSSGSVYWKRWTSSESSSETWTNIYDSNEVGIVVTAAYRGCVASGNPYDVWSSNGSSSTASYSISDTTTAGNTRVVAANINNPGTTMTMSWNSPLVERFDSDTDPGGQQNGTVAYVSIADRELVDAGAVTMAGTLSSAVGHIRFLVALKP
jgi:hypothetical protein